ncbi:TPR-like protein [Apiospora kogelbergensis]|uniref:TPR-like protein n=1 Tax=Apiospora kogelbergensis TaxID=1337665 RepID=UPI003131759D
MPIAGLVVTIAQAQVAARDRIHSTANPELYTTNADAAYAPPTATPSPDTSPRNGAIQRQPRFAPSLSTLYLTGSLEISTEVYVLCFGWNYSSRFKCEADVQPPLTLPVVDHKHELSFRGSPNSPGSEGTKGSNRQRETPDRHTSTADEDGSKMKNDDCLQGMENELPSLSRSSIDSTLHRNPSTWVIATFNIEKGWSPSLLQSSLMLHTIPAFPRNQTLLLREQGHYDESEKLSRQALEGREAELGKRHPHTLASASNLALVLQDQGQYREAEATNRRVLDAYKKELGMQHPSTLTSVSNLAFVLQEEGQYGEAEELNRRALEGRETVLEKQHPDSLMSLSNLAFTLRLQEKYDESEALNRQALEGREEQLGMQQPDTLASLNSLALVLRDRGEYEEAKGLSRRTLQGYRTELGAHHPYT